MALSMRSHQIIYLQPVHQCKELYHKCKYCKNNALYWIDLKWLWLFPQPLHSLNVCRCSSMHPFLNFPFHLYHFWLHNSHLFYPYLTNCLFIYCHCPTICQSTPPPSSVSTYHFAGFVLPTSPASLSSSFPLSHRNQSNEGSQSEMSPIDVEQRCCLTGWVIQALCVFFL